MLMRWYNFDRDGADFERLRRSFFGRPAWFSGRFPKVNLRDDGESLVLSMLAPGLGSEDVQIEVHGDLITVSGELRPRAPEGYKVHRAERGVGRFTRSFRLPYRVDAEKTSAKLTDGVLEVTLGKHADEQPRHIQISTN